MRRRRSSAHRELKHAKKELETLGQEKIAAVDLVSDRLRVRQEIARTIDEFGLTIEDASAIDMIIDGHAVHWRQSVEGHRHVGIAALDHLEVEVRSIVDALAERAQEEDDVRAELQSVAANLWDQVGDPEQPNIDPLR